MSDMTSGASGIAPAERPAAPDGATTGRVSWDDLAAFLAIARHGGLSAAAREIGSSAPTLGRRMRALERQSGRELFLRRTHGYDLTPDGEALCAELRQAEAIITRASRPATGDPRPLVRIAAGTWTMLALLDVLPRLIGTPPDLRVRLLQGEDILSIPRRETAIGFRSRRPTEDGLAGRRLRQVAFAPYAAPDAMAGWILVRSETPSARWLSARCHGRATIEVDTPRLALDLALRGMGQILLPTFLGDGQPGLGRVGSEIAELSHDQWVVTHAEDRNLPEIRRALDRVAEALG